MTSILVASGFKCLESLQEFSVRFPNIEKPVDSELQNIWICHKIPGEIPKFEEINLLPSEDYYHLLQKIKKKMNSSKDFFSLMTEFSPLSIFDKIYHQFKKELTTYIFTKCYLFYNWGINAFEPVLDHFEIHKQIEKSVKMLSLSKNKKPVQNQRRNNKFIENESESRARYRERSIDLFEDSLNSNVRLKSKLSSKAVKKAIEKTERFFDMPRNSSNPYHETFHFKKILYDMKQKPQWSKWHVLSKNNVDDLILYIINMPISSSVRIDDKLRNEHKNWLTLRELLNRFLKQHNIINKNNGYGRILKKHLKKVNACTNRRLLAIPKSCVCSYVIDILRRVLPLELFGSRHVRKNFFRGLIKVINGAKEQNFIWYPLLRSILINKTKLAWCSELGDNYSQSQIILKLFKFLVMHYILILLKNNFYITETGSSGFSLRFYRKGDLQSCSFACIKNLLKNKQIRPLKRKDYEPPTIERNWLETGVLNREDFKRKLNKVMSPDFEYKQSIAHIRFLPKNNEGDEVRIITNIPKKIPKGSGMKSKQLEKFFMIRSSWRKKKLYFVRLLLEFLVDKYGIGIRAEPYNPVLEAAWKKAVLLKESYGKLFFVKADITDAFGSVKYNILTDVLKNTLDDDSQRDRIHLRKIIEWKRTRWRIEKAARFSFSNRPKENSVMIHRSVQLHHEKKINFYYDSKFLEIIKQVVMMQRVEINGRVYRLIKGLAQGSAGRFSPQLCEIYYSSMDRKYFKEIINPSDSVLLRAVDDYLYITSDEEKARKFLELVQKGVDDYEVRFNSSKLKSNLIENTHQVLYLGLLFNFEDMSVIPHYKKYQQMGFLSTINLSDQWDNAHFNKDTFLERRSLRMNCLKLHPIVLNNGNLKIVRQTVFEASLVQSLRVINLANCLYSSGLKNDLVVYKVLLKSCNVIRGKVGFNILSRDEIKWLFLFAAANVLRRWSGQFKLLFMIIRFQLQKCEEAFINIGSELLLNFLKDDILDEEYWKRISLALKKLRN